MGRGRRDEQDDGCDDRSDDATARGGWSREQGGRRLERLNFRGPRVDWHAPDPIIADVVFSAPGHDFLDDEEMVGHGGETDSTSSLRVTAERRNTTGQIAPAHTTHKPPSKFATLPPLGMP